MRVIINPGTGPVADATEELAIAAATKMVDDIKLQGATFRRAPKRDEGDGRYGFVFSLDERSVDVDIPGLPLDRVRYMNGQNPWHFPRLYVDGNSWLWEFAVGCIRDALGGSE